MKFCYPLFLAFVCQFVFAQNQVPVLSNVAVSVSGGQIHVNYDLSDAESNTCEVKLLVSADGGQTYLNHTGSISGDFPAHWDPKLRIPRGQVVAAASIVSPKY